MATTNVDVEYYATPGVFTDLRAYGRLVDDLPRDIASLAAVVHGLLIHRFWAERYGVTVSPERDKEQGLHGADAIISRALELRDAPLDEARPPEQRVVGICRHFATLLCALLRQRGTPARARCGFATYFEPGRYVDHWVCEYWNADEHRWVMVDAQLDAFQRDAIKPDFDPLDVPRERFWVAGQAWQRCRSGDADPALFGIADMWGLWYVCGNLTLDLASLEKVELLPWEPFGLAQQFRGPVADADLPLLDRIAELTARADDAAVAELRSLRPQHDDLRVPDELVQRGIAADRSGATGANPITA